MPSLPSRILLSSPIGSLVAVSLASPATASPSEPSTSLPSIQTPLGTSCMCLTFYMLTIHILLQISLRFSLSQPATHSPSSSTNLIYLFTSVPSHHYLLMNHEPGVITFIKLSFERVPSLPVRRRFHSYCLPFLSTSLPDHSFFV
ncbi:hypothetical protein EDB19DRAFT_827571 [Suillus lakei]|nr:hypothetical protein EDB19DRAFT_827571 [Suillus lakei]